MMQKLINPFRYLPLRQAICWGVVALILTSVFTWQCGLRATSLTQIDFGGGTLWQATLRQLIIWVLFSVLLYIGGCAASKSNIRFIDVAAFNLFARIPFSLSLLIFAIPSVKSIMGYVADMNMEAVMRYMSQLTLIGVVSMLFSVWYIYWSYKAFAESANVKNGKGVLKFAVCFILSYTASIYLLRIIA